MTDDKAKGRKSSSKGAVPASVPASDLEAGTRIAEVVQVLGGDLAAAKICGVSESTVRNWRSGIFEPRRSELVEMARAANVTVEWLATGAEPKSRLTNSRIGLARDAVVLFTQRRSTVPREKAAQLMQEAAEYQLDVDGLEERHGEEYPPPSLVGDFVMVPRYDIAGSAGGGAIISSEQVVDYLAFKSEWVRNTLGVARKDLALISVKGDSMQPTLSDGDMILIDRSRSGVEDSGVYVLQLEGALMVKRVQRHLDGSLTVMSDNPKYALERVAPGTSLVVLGRVVWVGRRL
jgi:phage repressor protein C with HTH and peptisase S24 domain